MAVQPATLWALLTITSYGELHIFDWLVLQLSIQTQLHLLELLQKPGGIYHIVLVLMTTFSHLTASPSATVISFSFHSHSAATQQINTCTKRLCDGVCLYLKYCMKMMYAF